MQHPDNFLLRLLKAVTGNRSETVFSGELEFQDSPP